MVNIASGFLSKFIFDNSPNMGIFTHMNKSVSVLIGIKINVYRGEEEGQLVFFLKWLTQKKDYCEGIRLFAK